MKKATKWYILLLWLIASIGARAQGLDQAFNPGTGASTTVRAISIQSDDKILIGGDFTSYNGTSINRIARLNADGTLDTSFDPGTGPSASVRAISIQSDGKILIGGDFTSYNGTSHNRIVRLNADGTLDTSFDPGTGANATVQAISIQSDGKILICGDFISYNGTSRNYIARLNADGTLDTGFTPGTGPNAAVQALSIQSNGKILIGGDFTSYNGTSINRIARLNADGTLDTSFDPGTGANNIVRAISVLSNGKILICGDFIRINFVTRSGLARLNADGTLDTGFTPGTVGGGNVLAISVTSADAFLIVGGFTTYDGTAINRIA